MFRLFFFFNDTSTTEIYTLSLHDALPIYPLRRHALIFFPREATQTGCRVDHGLLEHCSIVPGAWFDGMRGCEPGLPSVDRKSTRLNSSHSQISYAVFCLKKKNQQFT